MIDLREAAKLIRGLFQRSSDNDLKVVMGIEKRKWIEGIFKRSNYKESVIELGVESERNKNQGRLPGF